MPTPQKEEIVSDVSEQLKDSQGVILTEYRGLTVAQISELRKKLRDSGTTFAVVKNTLFKRATEGLVEPNPKLDETLNGPTAVGFASKDAVETAKAFVDYIAANRNTPLKIKGAIVGGKFYNPAQVDALSKVPPRPVLYAQLLGSLNAPITGLAGTLNAVTSKLVYTLQAIYDKRSGEGAGEGA